MADDENPTGTAGVPDGEPEKKARKKRVVAATGLDPISRLTRDLRAAALNLGDHEARFLVDQYYQLQRDRIRSAHQVRTLRKEGEPNEIIDWFTYNAEVFENQMAIALDGYSTSKPIGVWARGIVGIGPIIVAGLLANVDISRAPTVGKIWRFAGLDPTVKWLPKTKRPWNGALKRLCCVPGTTITTRAGPRLIEQVKVGDEVLTHRGRWRPVAQVMSRVYDGDVVTLRAHGLGADGPTVTPDHPILTKPMRIHEWTDQGGRERFRAHPRVRRTTQIDDAAWSEIGVRIDAGERGRDIAAVVGCSEALVSMIRHGYTRQPTEDAAATWARADAVVPGWRVLSPTPPPGHSTPRIVLDDLPGLHNPASRRDVEVTEDVARLIGLWLGDGHTAKNRVVWSFGLHEGMLATFVVETLSQAFGIKARERITANMRIVICGSRQLQEWLVANAGKLAHGKRIPDNWMDAGEPVIRGLLRGLFEADGSLGDRVNYTSVNWRLAQSVVQMLRALNIPAGAVARSGQSVFPGRSKPTSCSYYKVQPNDVTAFYERVMGEIREPFVSTAVAERDGVGAWHTARDQVGQRFKGRVFNLEVEEDHSYVADGIAVHNCWLIGESFTKFANHPRDVYGQVYKARKAFEINNNDAGVYSPQAVSSLAEKKFGKDTDALAWYSGCYPAGTCRRWNDLELEARQVFPDETGKRTAWLTKARNTFLLSERLDPGLGVQMLPPARIQLRSQRYAVKLFLSHYHHVLFTLTYGEEPPFPYVLSEKAHIAHPELATHTHFVGPPNWPIMIEPLPPELNRSRERLSGPTPAEDGDEFEA